MAGNSERETSADRPTAEASPLLPKDDSRNESTIPLISQPIIILPFPVPRGYQHTPNPVRAESARKRKRCDKCGCQCKNKYTPPKPRAYCTNCRKHHDGVCWKATGGCYKCGEIGHRIRDCPKRILQKKSELPRAQTEAVETSTAQEAPSQAPIQVMSDPKRPNTGRVELGPTTYKPTANPEPSKGSTSQ